MAFKRAERRNAKLRLALTGTAGAGKTYSALLLAKEFGTRIAVMDSERGSASLYADLVPFDVEELEEKNIQEYLEKIKDAAQAGYEVLIIDSFSHSWQSTLEVVTRMGGWVQAGKHISPLVQKLIDAILSYPGHVIATLRSKPEHVIEKDEKTGKTIVRKVGLGTVARDGTDYEFGVIIDLTPAGGLEVSKSRCPALSGQMFTREDIPKIGGILRDWLNSGAPALAENPARLELAEKIRAAGSVEELKALLPEIQKLPPEDMAKIRPVYVGRKAEVPE